jgi:hypothetical protein
MSAALKDMNVSRDLAVSDKARVFAMHAQARSGTLST